MADTTVNLDDSGLDPINDKVQSQGKGKRSRVRTQASSQRRRVGLTMNRRWTTAGGSPFDQVEWENRAAVITDAKGNVVFEQKDIKVPTQWSQLATNVVVSKYFRGAPGSSDRENSVRQLIGRVVNTIATWADEDKYFSTKGDLETFRDELTYLLLHQHAAFNSPVWFNVGVEERPQCSACFINSVEDTMTSIMDLAKTECMLFKYGSGTGSNLSPLRGKNEQLTGGGSASGPVSFMRGYDSFAGVIKSGGKTRRAAKMVMLDIDHPDVEEFINCKANEEKKAWSLIDAGYDGAVDGEAYGSVFFQNANHSVRVSDDYMEAVENDGVWKTINRVDGGVASSHEARHLLQQMAETTHLCGDPGLQFDTTINKWHTCKATDRIYGSNPCSEYMFLNDSACNLASLNLMKFRTDEGEFDTESFKHAVDVVFTAMEVLVDRSSYPTPKITENSHNYRPLGLGYANLGALLMARGLPYDSDAGRAYAASITALMCGEAYCQSARMAQVKGAFKGHAQNAESMLDVMRMHRAAVDDIDHEQVAPSLFASARTAWDEALELGTTHGYRNAQTTVLAPTGTIGFMMDCDTTGIEPDISLIKYKKLVGGGMLKIVNQTVPEALDLLGYQNGKKAGILEYLEAEETIEGAPHLKDQDLAVFDCAFKALKGTRSIAPMGHIRMMAAAQPFLSGAISKTVNMPTDATVDDIADAYKDSWRLGLKAVAIYRDGCKRSQPLNTSKDGEGAKNKAALMKPVRHRLPDERAAVTHKFSIAGHEGYVTVGLYEDGAPGELFIRMSKEGSTISGLMDSLATSISLAFQYGVPLGELCRKFTHTRYEPSGFTGNKEIPIAKSITDYLFRWLAMRFIKGEGSEAAPANLSAAAMATPATTIQVATPASRTHGLAAQEDAVFVAQADAPSCADCGSIMVRSGACYKCLNCGSTSGCS